MDHLPICQGYGQHMLP